VSFRLTAVQYADMLIHLRRVLITTDVWARGIDVQQVSLVINYDLPAYASLTVGSYCR
jgi:superfamily II DNA/RNA helicase